MDGWMDGWIDRFLSCLQRFCQGSTNVSFQRSVLCVQERVQNASYVFFSGTGAEKTLHSKLHSYHHCSENLMRFWNLLIDHEYNRLACACDSRNNLLFFGGFLMARVIHFRYFPRPRRRLLAAQRLVPLEWRSVTAVNPTGWNKKIGLQGWKLLGWSNGEQLDKIFQMWQFFWLTSNGDDHLSCFIHSFSM